MTPARPLLVVIGLFVATSACSTRLGVLGRLPRDRSCDGGSCAAPGDASSDGAAMDAVASSDASPDATDASSDAGEASVPCDGGACPDRWVWVRQLGDDASQAASAIASRPIGLSAIGGRLPGLADLGRDTIGSGAADADAFVALLDYAPSFSPRWARSYGSPADDALTSLAFLSDDSLLITGSLGGAIDLGGGVLPFVAGEDVFLARLDPSGAHVFSKAFGGAGDEHASDVAVGAFDEVVLVGSLGTSPVDFGSGDRSAAGGRDAFVARFDADGTPAWSLVFGDTADQVATGVAMQVAPTSPTGHAFVVGTFSGVLATSAATLTATGGEDVFVLALDAGGNSVWSRRYGDADDQRVASVAVDPGTGAVAITGAFRGTIDFGCGPMTSAGGWDGYVAILSPSDFSVVCAYSTRFGDAADQRGLDVAFDYSSHLVVVGDFHGTLELGGFARTSAGGADLFAAKLTPPAVDWLESAGDASDQSLTGVAIDSSNRIRVVGTIAGTSTFDEETITVSGALGATDVLVGELRP